MTARSQSTTLPRSLTDKVALVTGGSRGIGAAIVRRLARDGATVYFTYSGAEARANELERLVEEEGGKARGLRADATDPAAIRAAVAHVVAERRGIDILVNNAGIAMMAPLEEFTLDAFDRILAVNVKAVFVTTQEVVRHMGSGGRVINIGSVNSDNMPFAGGSVYALTKGAVESFGRGLARDLGPRGITVNTIQPGPVDTEMNPANGPFADSLRNLLAVGRYGKVDEVAGMVAYLASPEAAYVTGAKLKIDGGFDA